MTYQRYLISAAVSLAIHSVVIKASPAQQGTSLRISDNNPSVSLQLISSPPPVLKTNIQEVETPKSNSQDAPKITKSETVTAQAPSTEAKEIKPQPKPTQTKTAQKKVAEEKVVEKKIVKEKQIITEKPIVKKKAVERAPSDIAVDQTAVAQTKAVEPSPAEFSPVEKTDDKTTSKTLNTAEPKVAQKKESDPIKTEEIEEKIAKQDISDSENHPSPVTPTSLPKLVDTPVFTAKPTPINYPRLAKRRGYEGKVVIEVWVSKNGEQTKHTIVDSSGFPMLDEAALQAISQWQFGASYQQGQAIAHRVQIPINFKLD